MKTKRKKPTIKEVSTRVKDLEGGNNMLTARFVTQAKLFTELISFLDKKGVVKEDDFKEFLKERYIPNKIKENEAKQKQDTKQS